MMELIEHITLDGALCALARGLNSQCIGANDSLESVRRPSEMIISPFPVMIQIPPDGDPFPATFDSFRGPIPLAVQAFCWIYGNSGCDGVPKHLRRTAGYPDPIEVARAQLMEECGATTFSVDRFDGYPEPRNVTGTMSIIPGRGGRELWCDLTVLSAGHDCLGAGITRFSIACAFHAAVCARCGVLPSYRRLVMSAPTVSPTRLRTFRMSERSGDVSGARLIEAFCLETSPEEAGLLLRSGIGVSGFESPGVRQFGRHLISAARQHETGASQEEVAASIAKIASPGWSGLEYWR